MFDGKLVRTPGGCMRYEIGVPPVTDYIVTPAVSNTTRLLIFMELEEFWSNRLLVNISRELKRRVRVTQ